MFRLHACFFVVGAVWLIVASPVSGGEVVTVDDVVVVSSPIIEGNVLDRYAGQTTRVSEDQIDNLNAQDMTAALRKTPGVNISRYNPVGSFGGGEGGAVFIRGMGSSRPGSEIKTFVDGVPMYMGVWNHPLMDLMSIDTAHAVEVYKSPQPQNFGNAVAAINMMPKRQITRGTSSTARIAAGSYDTIIGSAESGGRFECFDYYIGGGYRHSNGHRDHSEGETGDVFARFGYQINDQWDAYFFGLFSDNYAQDPGEKEAAPSLREGTYETGTLLTSLTLSNTYGSAKGHLKLYRNAGEGNWLDQPTDTPGVSEDLYNDFEFYGIKLKEALHLWEAGEIITGMDVEHTEGDYQKYFSDGSTDHWDGHDASMVSPYVALSHRFIGSSGLCITPSAGVRYYDHSDFGTEFAPHAGVIVAKNDVSFHAGYSRGVVYPGLDVVVFSEEVIPGLGTTWKALDPEIMDHYETGVSYTLTDLFQVDVVWFYNNGKDRYVFITSSTSPPVYGNVEEYVTKGIEISLSMNPTESLALFLGGTFMRADPSDTPYAPETTLSAGMSYRFMSALTLNVDAQYLDQMFVNSQSRRATTENTGKVDSYTVVNAKLSYAFNLKPGSVSGTLFVAGENLTDTDYQYQPGYPMPGINGMAGVSLSF